ncbi:MAG: hypothetical protein BWY13_00895 [Euryarchaeota archaeon ADurb.Bin190]|nr:MAG: hypothetical protein BWY13_00895 [Euryarchaeota archaeon ADurb.Bin190]
MPSLSLSSLFVTDLIRMFRAEIMTSPRTMESSMVASVGITDSCLSGMERPDLVIMAPPGREGWLRPWTSICSRSNLRMEEIFWIWGRLSPLQTAAAAEAAFSPRSLPEARLPPTIPCFS